MLFSIPQNYSAAKVFAAAGEVRVAKGPAGADVIETFSVPGGVRNVSSPFLGQFHSWFLDGARLLTVVSNTVRVYTKGAAQADVKVLGTVANVRRPGPWFWSFDANQTLDVYAVGASASPTASFVLGSSAYPVPSALTIGVLGAVQVGVIDLDRAVPAIADSPIPVASANTYAAVASNQWIVGNAHGVIVDVSTSPSAPRFFGFGEAWSIAGGADQVAVATASGRIVLLDARTRAEQGRIDFPSSSLAMSDDGTVLAAAGSDRDAHGYDDRSVKVFSLPSRTELSSFPYAYSSPPYPLDTRFPARGKSWVGSSRQ